MAAERETGPTETHNYSSTKGYRLTLALHTTTDWIAVTIRGTVQYPRLTENCNPPARTLVPWSVVHLLKQTAYSYQAHHTGAELRPRCHN
ncbi:Hypothetical predicted protein [Pelobates cultripes]|uniref:Uncharacterized protein n=1 Tax=Pelobates cultripes TaxID=61616 RepID=A0AAD1WBG3_PELCU|nr:Hypothetical predicted protein [Pelobates cultripes]